MHSWDSMRYNAVKQVKTFCNSDRKRSRGALFGANFLTNLHSKATVSRVKLNHSCTLLCIFTSFSHGGSGLFGVSALLSTHHLTPEGRSQQDLFVECPQTLVRPSGRCFGCMFSAEPCRHSFQVCVWKHDGEGCRVRTRLPLCASLCGR